MQWVKDHIWLCLAALVALMYVVWMVWFKPAATPTTAFVQPKPVITAPKETGPVIIPPIKTVPKKKVQQRFPEAQIKDDEEWVDTVDLPSAPNGAVVLTKIDTQSGEVTNQIKNKPAPWLAFEDTNYIGIGVEQHTGGNQYGKVYYKRDVLRVKDVHLQIETEGKVSNSDIQGFIGANVELRF